MNTQRQCIKGKDEVIKEKIRNIDLMNKQLLKISQQVHNTSFFSNNTSKASTINIAIEFQKEMRETLEGVIENIKQFYLDIDQKLKNVALIVSQSVNQSEDFKYSMLFEKIKNLESSLKKTQENETKLLEIIEKMIQKHQITDQPTMLRQEPFLRNRQKTISTQNIISATQRARCPTANQEEKIQKSLHENLYFVDESIVSSSLKSLRINKYQENPQEQVYIKKLYSKSTVPVEQKKSLKIDRNFNICDNVNKVSFMKPNKDSVPIYEDKRHRMNFMMEKLQK